MKLKGVWSVLNMGGSVDILTANITVEIIAVWTEVSCDYLQQSNMANLLDSLKVIDTGIGLWTLD